MLHSKYVNILLNVDVNVLIDIISSWHPKLKVWENSKDFILS